MNAHVQVLAIEMWKVWRLLEKLIMLFLWFLKNILIDFKRERKG